MKSTIKHILFIFSFWQAGTAQPGGVDIKVYDFEEGLSHRNVFKIAQDSAGLIWIATINGLNRFDGYDFVQYNSHSPQNHIPHDAISDMLMTGDGEIWLANPDYLTLLRSRTNTTRQVKVKPGEIVRRESWVPHNLFQDDTGRLWMATYDEQSASTTLETFNGDSITRMDLKVPGKYPRRPIAQLGKHIYVGAFENRLWKLGDDGRIAARIEIPATGKSEPGARVVHMQQVKDELWVLMSDNRIFILPGETGTPQLHPMSSLINGMGTAVTFLVDEEKNIWVAGQDMLVYYEAHSGTLRNYGSNIRQIIKYPVTYRQIFQDRSGVIWAASNFGAIKIVRSNDLFTQYLSGGSEYCSNVYCSTRGVTEDEEGNIYISYYNSIHVLNPQTDNIRLLFPSNNYFNYPFGLNYYDGALYTGNGRRIDLNTLEVDTIFSKPNVDLGDVMVDRDGELWFGYLDWLYVYDPAREVLREFEDDSGTWDSLDGTISFLYQGITNDYIWVGTLGNGFYKIDKSLGRIAHYHTNDSSPVRLKHNQVNAIYEDDKGYLWIGTGNGLHRLGILSNELKVFTVENGGLPNNFINGILPEGDSCLWISTDNGLCRFSINRADCLNFFQQDGLSANEFNRISFYKASNGRMYFGGLNGVNAFYPGHRFQERKEESWEAPLVLTQFSRFNDGTDSLHVMDHGLSAVRNIVLSHRDKIFSFRFALADYRQPQENQFSFRLEGYEAEWSPLSSVNIARYNNIPAGNYTFRVRAQVAMGEWSPHELSIPVIIRRAYYRTWWFLTLCGLLLAGGVYALMQYRLYAIRKRQNELEQLVKARTRELEKEKQKSEELLLNILPAETAEELKKYGAARAKRHNEVTVMFSDFKGFSRISGQMEPEELVREIDLCFRAFDKIMEKYGIEKIKTVGDAYMCVGGISSEGVRGAVQVVKAALDIQEFMNRTKLEKESSRELYFEARIGIHSGAVVAGIVGIKKFAYDIWGDTVNIAARMETYGAVGKVNISEATHRLVNDQFKCSFQGVFNENNSGDIRMYFVEKPLTGSR